jgi:hypothetical protein
MSQVETPRVFFRIKSEKIQPPGRATLKQLSFQNHPARRQALANNHSYFAREAPTIKLAKVTASEKISD